MRFPKVLSIGDVESLYDHLRTETSSGANDRRTALDIQINRVSMDAQGATVRWMDHNVPLLQMLMRTGRFCITEESVTLEKHKIESLVTKQFVQDASRPSDASCDGCPTKIDRYLMIGVQFQCEGVTQDEVVCERPPCQ